MEQKRVLWIVVAVGLFLLVVIGAALLFYNPVQNTTKLTALEGNGSLWINTDGRTATVYTSEDPMVTPSADEEVNSDSVVQNLTVHSENTFVYTSNATTAAPASETAKVPEEQTIQVVAPKTETPAANVTPASAVTPVTASAAKNTSAATTNTTVTTPAPAATKTTTAATNAKSTGTSSSTSTAASTAKTTTVKTVTKKAEDSFFVQVGSFTSKKNAEDARSLLTDEKIPAEIFTWKNDKDIVYYRLRVGPYKTKTEANYWLSRIKLIDGFATEAAYVVNSPATED